MKFTISRGFLLIMVFSFLIFSSSKVTAQNRSAIHGLLLDSIPKHPLELATVAIVNDNDTTLIAYTLSDKHGHFEFTGLPPGRAIQVIISYVGYKIIRKSLMLEKGQDLDMGEILFSPESLGEVIIHGTRPPVVVKKDTIEFNIAAFKTRPNAVVEELLKKLPGIQVNMDGSILVHGRPVSKLLVNGKAFFGNDPTVATKNLEADLVAKIQIFDDRDQDPDHKLKAIQVNKVINLKLKKNIKKSTIGKAYAGVGTRGRYEAGGILSTFRDTLQISLVGLGNNLNGTKLTNDDLNRMGGFDRSGGNQTASGTFGRLPGDVSAVNGIEDVKAGGVNINNDYGDRLKINLAYFYTYKKTSTVQKQKQEQMIPDSLELTSLSATNAVTTIGKHAVGATVIWNPDTLNSFRYQPSATFILNNKQITNTGSSYNDTIPLLSRSDGKEYDAGHDNSFSHDFFWHRKLSNEGESINISHSLTVNNEADEDQTINDLTSFTKELNSTLFDRQAVTRSNSNMIVLSVNYNYPFNKQLSAEITGITNYSSSFYSLLTYDKNPATGQYDLFSESQSNLLNRSINTESLSPLLVYQIKDRYQLSIGVVSQRQDIQDHFLTGDGSNHRYLNFLPTVVVEIPNTRINFGEQITQPGITQLQPDTIEYSQLYKVTGNPSLQPRDSHYLSCMYGKYDENSQSFLNIFESVSLSQRDVVQDYTISTNGNTALTYVNRNGGLSATSTIDYSKSFKKISSWQNSIHVDLETSFTRMAFILNGNDGIQSTSNFGLSGSADFNYNDILNLSGQYGFSKSATVYKRVQYAPVTTYVQNFIPNIDLNWPKRVSFDASCTINYNPQVPQGFKQETNILNAAISIQIQKHDRGQLKLSAYDLLNQNVSVYRTAANNAIITNEQQLLNRYFLLTYLYKFGVNR